MAIQRPPPPLVVPNVTPIGRGAAAATKVLAQCLNGLPCNARRPRRRGRCWRRHSRWCGCRAHLGILAERMKKKR